jgi:gliding motility-associated lipoprotein GldD
MQDLARIFYNNVFICSLLLCNSNDFITFARYFMRMKRFLLLLLITTFLITTFTACQRRSVPRPYGYFRIAIPDTMYTICEMKDYPYAFRLSQHAYTETHFCEGEQYWIDIQYPTLNATIHCSYKKIDNNLRQLSRDAQEFLYSHAAVASAIPTQEYTDDERRVYGLYYELHGNTATPIQFYLTDSVRHFFRGSVYCNTIPNQDSLRPIYDYLRKDARVIMESMEWR